LIFYIETNHKIIYQKKRELQRSKASLKISSSCFNRYLLPKTNSQKAKTFYHFKNLFYSLGISQILQGVPSKLPPQGGVIAGGQPANDNSRTPS
jgi:hypothetical protein